MTVKKPTAHRIAAAPPLARYRPEEFRPGAHLQSDAELAKFTGAGRFGYFRHILQAKEIPIGEVLAAHLLDVGRAEALLDAGQARPGRLLEPEEVRLERLHAPYAFDTLPRVLLAVIEAVAKGR